MKTYRDWVLENGNLLQELAMPRSDLYKHVFAISYILTEHLFYLKLYPNDTRNINHWKGEIIKFIKSFSSIIVKPNSKKLESKFYFEYLYNSRYNGLIPDDYIKDIYNDVKRNEKKQSEIKINDIDCDELDRELHKFYKDLSELCANTVTDVNSVIKLIDNWYNKKLK